jgi:hypothetical protein
MALLWIEGFENFGTSIGSGPAPFEILERKYPLTNRTSFMDIETGRNGRCLEIAASDDYIQCPHINIDATSVIGMAIRLPVPSSTTTIFALVEGSNLGVNLRITTAGYIEARLGTGQLAVSILGVPFNAWFYLELKVLTHDSAGTVDVKVNGTSYISLSGIDTQPGSNAYHTAFRLGQVGAGGALTRYDDLYFLDGSGSANNDFLGNRKVIALNPDGAGDDSDWTPSAGSNYQNVDDGGLTDDDTTYNETSTDTHQDLYTYDDLPGDAASVDGIQVLTEVRVTAGQMDISNVSKTGTTTDTGSPETVTDTDWGTVTRVLEEDPDTAAAWTPSGVNGAQFGILANT